MKEIILVHYAEIGTKGKNRGRFEDKLIENLKKVLGEDARSVERRYGKILCFVDGKANEEKIVGKLSNMPGIANFAFASRAELDIIHMEKKLLEAVNDGKDFESFGIKTKRSDKKFELNSAEICQRLGGKIVEKFDKKVDLKNPDIMFYIEVGEQEALIYSSKDKYSGARGLPVGISENVLVSLSGGIDSPVASYLMMKRGCRCTFVHFHNEKVSGQRVLDKIKKLVGELKDYNLGGKLIVVPFSDLQNEIVKSVRAEDRMIVYRRYMMKILNGLCTLEKAKGIVTGDSVGQVASQTVDNLQIIYSVLEGKVPIFSPLIGLDKEEIIQRAINIGTFETSIQEGEDCCSFMIANHPSTKGNLGKIEGQEEGIDKKVIEKALKEIEVYDL